MAEQTGIAWTDSTFNPWIGCEAISPGCKNCYAAAYAKRVGRDFAQRTRTSAAYWKEPFKWNKKAAASGKPWRVFCASLADVFDNDVPDEWRLDLWDLIETTPALTWLLLTKRISNAIRMLRTNDWATSKRWDVWIGATIVNAEEAARDVPKLLATPARVRFVSYEPALGPVDWSKYPGIDWIIVGGESTQGAKAREFKIEWAHNTIMQARDIKAAPFVKQLGSGHGLSDRAGSVPNEWPESLRVQEFPGA